MKKEIVVGLIACLTAASVLTGCGKKESGSGNETLFESTDSGSKEKSEVAEDNENKSENENENKSVEAAADSFSIAQHHVTCSVDGNERANGVYPEIILPGEYKDKYPKLASYIDELNGSWKASVKENVSNYANWAVESMEYYDDPVFCSEISASVVRADDRLFTILTGFYDDAGGAHPNHGSESINIDPVTGELVDIKSVLADTKVFPAIVRAELEKAYPGIGEEVDSLYFKDEGDPDDIFLQKLNNNSYSWNVDEKGMLVFFSPYEIASYAAGYMEILLSAQDYPELVQKAYRLDEAQNIAEKTNVYDVEAEVVEAAASGQELEIKFIDNPTWKQFIKDGQNAAGNHIYSGR